MKQLYVDWPQKAASRGKAERNFWLWWVLQRASLLRQEKAMAPHSSTLAWKIPWTEEPGRLQSRGRTESDTTERLHFHFTLSCIGEGNGNPLQCSCLENPRNGGACWAAIYGVAQSRTRLKQLSSSSSLLRRAVLFPFMRGEQVPGKESVCV